MQEIQAQQKHRENPFETLRIPEAAESPGPAVREPHSDSAGPAVKGAHDPRPDPKPIRITLEDEVLEGFSNFANARRDAIHSVAMGDRSPWRIKELLADMRRFVDQKLTTPWDPRKTLEIGVERAGDSDVLIVFVNYDRFAKDHAVVVELTVKDHKVTPKWKNPERFFSKQSAQEMNAADHREYFEGAVESFRAASGMPDRRIEAEKLADFLRVHSGFVARIQGPVAVGLYDILGAGNALPGRTPVAFDDIRAGLTVAVRRGDALPRPRPEELEREVKAAIEAVRKAERASTPKKVSSVPPARVEKGPVTKGSPP